jgi:energy-coupling factor transporter ATP-binding protein EcfA2
LRRDLDKVSFAFPSPISKAAANRLEHLIQRLDDAILPRLRDVATPQIVVLFGATGCGKSIVLNTLSRCAAVPTGVIRPTTRRPVMAATRADLDCLAGHPVRTMVTPVAAPAALTGRAVVELPDSGFAERADQPALGRLIRLADLRIAVTSASRYGDGTLWELLLGSDAETRPHGLIVNRVASRDSETIRVDLTERLGGLPTEDPRAVIVHESDVLEQCLSEDDGTHLDEWLDELAESASGGGTGIGPAEAEWWSDVEAGIGRDVAALARAADRCSDEAEGLRAALDTAWQSIKVSEAALLSARTSIHANGGGPSAQHDKTGGEPGGVAAPAATGHIAKDQTIDQGAGPDSVPGSGLATDPGPGSATAGEAGSGVALEVASGSDAGAPPGPDASLDSGHRPPGSVP